MDEKNYMNLLLLIHPTWGLYRRKKGNMKRNRTKEKCWFPRPLSLIHCETLNKLNFVCHCKTNVFCSLFFRLATKIAYFVEQHPSRKNAKPVQTEKINENIIL